jgi:hypothetical protein
MITRWPVAALADDWNAVRMDLVRFISLSPQNLAALSGLVDIPNWGSSGRDVAPGAHNLGFDVKVAADCGVRCEGLGAGRRARADALTRGGFNAEHGLWARISRAGGLGWNRSQALGLPG